MSRGRYKKKPLPGSGSQTPGFGPEPMALVSGRRAGSGGTDHVGSGATEHAVEEVDKGSHFGSLFGVLSSGSVLGHLGYLGGVCWVRFLGSGEAQMQFHRARDRIRVGLLLPLPRPRRRSKWL